MPRSRPRADLEAGPVASMSLLVLGLFLYKLAPTQADADLWGHVKFGGDLLGTVQVLRSDPYSYASGVVPWINHEVLAEAASYLAWSLGGGTGLVVLKLLVGMVVAGGLWFHLVRSGLKLVRAAIVLIVSSLALLPTLATMRPQVFTVLFFTLTLLVLYEIETGRPSWIWFLPVILAVWINFHGGVLAGLGVVLAYLVTRIGAKLLRRQTVPWMLWFVPVLCAAALLINPFGYRLPEFLLRTATVARPDISEWGPLHITSIEGVVYLGLLGSTGWALLRRPNMSTAPLMAVYIVSALAPLTAARHLALFAVSAVVVGARPMAAAWPRTDSVDESEARSSDPLDRAPIRWALGAIGVIFALLSAPALSGVQLGSTFTFPARAIDVLERSGVQARLATHFDWGQYALWHLHPEILVAPDGRRETVYDASTYERYLMFNFGVGDWAAFLEEPPADMALLPSTSPAANLLRLDADWLVVYEDPTAVLFARAGYAGVAAIRATPPRDLPTNGVGLEFPGPE